MTLFLLLPSYVANHIEKLQQDFVWDELGEEANLQLVSQAKLHTPISKGGLGVRNLLLFSCALLGKWLWRYQNERERPCRGQL